MWRVFKYAFSPDDHVTISMPKGAELLHVDFQHGTPCLWALVDPNAPMEDRHFRFAGTGHPITETNLKHVGTFLLSGGAYVFHLFEVL